MAYKKGAYANESAFTRQASRWIEQAGGVVISLVASKMQRDGLPDRYFSHPKFAGWAEFKRDERGCTDLQRLTLIQLRMTGSPAVVVRYRSSGWVDVEDENLTKFKSLDLTWLEAQDRPGLVLLDAIAFGWSMLARTVDAERAHEGKLPLYERRYA